MSDHELKIECLRLANARPIPFSMTAYQTSLQTPPDVLALAKTYYAWAVGTEEKATSR
jgi:hypothetical protein